MNEVHTSAVSGWMILRRDGAMVGPFFTRSDAEDYLNDGDSITAVNEHGNIIDYSGGFDEDDEGKS